MRRPAPDMEITLKFNISSKMHYFSSQVFEAQSDCAPRSVWSIGAIFDDLGSVGAGSAWLFGIGWTACGGIVDASLTCVPSSGSLPFTTQMTATLTNNYTGQMRRLAARVDVTLASGTYFPSWKAGYTNVAAGSSYITAWNQNLPALGTLVGDNLFELVAEDVTPSPYNQPPYPMSGDTDTDSCLVTGVAP